jgi:hypothetical protein
MLPSLRSLLIVLVLAMTTAACASQSAGDRTTRPSEASPADASPAEQDPPGEDDSPVDEVADAAEPDEEPGGSGDDAEDADDGPEAPDPAEVDANELGVIPVLMYHRLLEGGGGPYDLSPEEFRDELERLYDEGFRPVRLKDMVRGEIDVPAGKTPVVLTFDDSTREQAALDENGKIAADTAIGILIEFAETRPDFEATASLYVNAHPFGGGADSDDIVRKLHELGFELGNHTSGHARLDHLAPDDVRRELVQGAEVVTDVVGDAEVVTLALPLGIWSDPRELAYAGEWEGRTYEHEGILLVGANPAPSPFHGEFDPMAIPRIRSGPWDGGEPDYASGFWLDWLADNPERRYVSDGDPSRVSFPEEMADQLSPDHEERANPY